MIGRLDRYLLRRGANATITVAVLMVVISLSIDFVINIGTIAKGGDRLGQLALVRDLYGWRLPQLANIALPLSAVIATLVVCAPMLKRGEFVALSASGVSPARAARALPLLALLVGLVDVAIADLVTPHATVRTTEIQDKLENQRRMGRVWQVPTTGSSWFAARAQGLIVNDPPSIDRVVIASASGLVMADRLLWVDSRWQLQGRLLEFRVAPDGECRLLRPAEILLEGDLALPYDPKQLYAKLLPRDTMRGSELLRTKDPSNIAYAWIRWSRALFPLLAVLAALPVFVRFAHKDNIIAGIARALGAAALPVAALVVGGLACETSGLPPALVIAVASAAVLAPTLWLYWRWRL